MIRQADTLRLKERQGQGLGKGKKTYKWRREKRKHGNIDR